MSDRHSLQTVLVLFCLGCILVTLTREIHLQPAFTLPLQVDEGTPPEPQGSFVDYQTTMVKFSKAIAITAQEMVGDTDSTLLRIFT